MTEFRIDLRRLTTVPALSSFCTLIGQYFKSLTVAVIIMISNKCPIIAEQVVVIFMTSMVTTATL